MRAGRSLALVVSLALGIAAVAGMVRLVGRGASLRAELGRVHVLSLSDRLAQRLTTLKDRVFITWYVSPRDRMPPRMKRIGRDVTDLLETMRAHSDGRLEFEVVDPTATEDLKRYAAKRKVAPGRVRSVAQDSFSQAEVWNTLTIAYGPHKPAVLSGIAPEHLPRLQEMIAAQLDQLESPRKPVFGLAAPAGFDKFRAWLAARGEVRSVDLDRAGADVAIPADVDVLFWLAPRHVDEAAVRAVRGLLARGRSAVLAAERFDCALDVAAPAEREPSVEFARRAVDPDLLFGPFGLRPADAILLDRRSDPISIAPAAGASQPAKVPAPFRVNCLSLNQDFHAFARDPGGTLVFVAPAPFALDGKKLQDDGFTAEVLATSSDDSRLIETPVGRTALAKLAEQEGIAVAKQPLIVRLVPDDPFAGQLVACAATSPFRDDLFDAELTAHTRLAAAVVDTLASDARLVAAGAAGARAAPIAPLSPSARFWWRAFVVFLAPIVLLLPRARAMLRPRSTPASRDARRPPRRAVALACCGTLAVLIIARLVAGHDVVRDVSTPGANDLAPETRRLAAACTGANALRFELLCSPDDRLPPELRPQVRAARSLAERLAAAGADVTIERVDPGEFDGAKRAALERQGVTSTRATSKDDEVLTVRTVWSALRLTIAGRSEALPFPDVASFENLEFRVAFALWRLQTGKRVRVAFASDLPRLSGAEAFEYYQQAGMIPPAGKDQYSLARDIVHGVDFDVTHVDFRHPTIPADAGALVVLQPRRDAAPMLAALADWLYRGGHALLAAQHFVFLSRQFPGVQFRFDYWPQPQSPDVDNFWFPEFGVKLIREPFFDRHSMPVRLESWAKKSGRREFTSMELSQPFVVRASAAAFATDSPVTRNLGDQPFLFPAFFELDRDVLRGAGLEARSLIESSDHTWSFDWRGGFLHDEDEFKAPGAARVKSVAVKAGDGVKQQTTLVTLELDEPGNSPPEVELATQFAARVLEVRCAPGDHVDRDALLVRTTGVLAEPPEIELGEPKRRGRVPLAIELVGQFPWPKHAFQFAPVTVGPDGKPQPSAELPPFPTPEPKDAARPGRLVFLGCSEPFKDDWLTQLRPSYRADQLLLNAVGALALEPALADVLTHRAVARGFEPPAPDVRAFWRVASLAFLPALLAFVALVRFAWAAGARS